MISCRQPSAAFAWESLTNRPRYLTLSVVRWCSAGASTSDSALPESSEESSARMPPNQGRPLHLPVKARGACRPRAPSVGSTSPCDEMGCVCSTCSPNVLQPEHPLRCPLVCPPCQGCWASLRAAIPACSPTRGSKPLQEEMSLANLCSRLIVTRTLWISNFQAHGSHRSTRCDLSQACTALAPRFDSKPSTPTSDDRCRYLRP